MPSNDDYMKALILDGSRKEDSISAYIMDKIQNVLKERNFQIKALILRDQNISSCLGCFDCWIKTPGVCVINDEGRAIAKEYVRSDLVILLSPVVFGGYSPELKKALERMIPNILPFYTKIGGEIHHSARYETYPKMFGIGFLPSPDQESETIFKKLIERNSISFYSEKYSARVVYSNDPPEEVYKKVAETIAEVID